MPRVRGANGRWVRTTQASTDSSLPTTIPKRSIAKLPSSRPATPTAIDNADLLNSNSNINATGHARNNAPGLDYHIPNARPAAMPNKSNIHTSDGHSQKSYSSQNSALGLQIQSPDIGVIGNIFVCLFAVAFISWGVLPAFKDIWYMIFAYLYYVFRGCWLFACYAPTSATPTSTWNPLCGQSNFEGEGIVGPCILGSTTATVRA